LSLARIISEEDADRVWSSVENGIKMMMEEKEKEEKAFDEEY
jgi:predicted oxidoreductase (fatty acid repression mutant protein)